ncbi:MAG: hypothetical protein AAFP02_18150 [Bacteroidota bacterium]
MKYYSPLVALLALSLCFSFPPKTSDKSDCTVSASNLKGDYEGECKNGFAHGRGKAIGKDEYMGEFKNGLPHGKGRLTYANGDEYIGEFRKGLRHGKGYLRRSGEVEITDNSRWTTWKNDKFIKTIPKGEFTIARIRNVARHSVKLVDDRENRVVINISTPMQISGLNINTSSGRYDMQGPSRLIVFDPQRV